jgi:hypothetical protein
MELIAEYLEIHKKVHPWLKDYLERGAKLKPHEFAIQRKMQESHNPFFRMARGSGKTGYHLALMERMIEDPSIPPYHFRVSDELISGLNDPVSNAIQEASRRAAREMEQRLFDSIMRGLGIENTPSDNVIRGRSSRNLHFDMEYMAQWAGDRDGDVPAISENPGWQEEI